MILTEPLLPPVELSASEGTDTVPLTDEEKAADEAVVVPKISIVITSNGLPGRGRLIGGGNMAGTLVAMRERVPVGRFTNVVPESPEVSACVADGLVPTTDVDEGIGMIGMIPSGYGGAKALASSVAEDTTRAIETPVPGVGGLRVPAEPVVEGVSIVAVEVRVWLTVSMITMVEDRTLDGRRLRHDVLALVLRRVVDERERREYIPTNEGNEVLVDILVFADPVLVETSKVPRFVAELAPVLREPVPPPIKFLVG